MDGKTDAETDAKIEEGAGRARKSTGPFSRFEWLIASRYLRSRRKETFISVIAGFSFVGIMLGVATLIIVMSVMNGFRQELMSKILGLNGHLLIQTFDQPTRDYEAIRTVIEGVDGVRFAVAFVEGQALASSDAGASGALVRGLTAEDLGKLTSVAESAGPEAMQRFAAGEGIIPGNRLASALALGTGDSMTLVSPRGEVTPFGVTPRIVGYPIVGLFQIGMAEFDSAIAYLPLAEAQDYFNVGDGVTAIEVYVDDPDDVDAVHAAIAAAVPEPLLVTDWRQRNATFFSALQIERNVMFVILTLIVLVAALNIVSGLTMLVKDKGKDIAIVRTMGATRGAILRIFVMTGAAIGVVGTLAGLLLGTIVCLNVENLRQFFSWLSGKELFSPDIYFLSQLPAEMEAGEVAMVVIMALVLSLIATLYPAWRAAQLDPGAGVEERMTVPLRLEGVTRSFSQGEQTLDVLRGVDLTMNEGELVALVGPSGSGKSTLLQIAGLLEPPDGGEVFVDGRASRDLDDEARSALRRDAIGFVYQAHHLLPEFSALENVVLPQLIAGLSRDEAKDRGQQLLGLLGLSERAGHRPSELSGGEQQRVAVARALANAPSVLLADEPTGNLDPETSERVFKLLTGLVKAAKVAALVATHNLDLAARMDRRVTVQDGVIVELD